jgi:ribosome maturation factor RimP
MLRNSITKKPLFVEMSPLIEKMGLKLVDIQESEQHSSFQIRIAVKALNRITTVEDCTRIHKAVEPRLELLSGNKDLQLEVSTPGIQRVFKDVYEFEVFSGDAVKVYDDRKDDWVEGIISHKDDDAVYLIQENSNEEKKMIQIPLVHVRKAKLHAVWEGKE